jgi:hypothetical protein
LADQVASEIGRNLEPGLDDLLLLPFLTGLLAREALVRLLAQCVSLQNLLESELQQSPHSGHARAGSLRHIDRGNEPEYLSFRDLTERIPYTAGTIRNLMSKGELRLGEHYVKPRGRIMFRWTAVRVWLDSARGRTR